MAGELKSSSLCDEGDPHQNEDHAENMHARVVSRIFRTFGQATAPLCVTCG